MSRKYSNITEIDENLSSVQSAIGDVSKISDTSDGTLVGAIQSLQVANNGGKVISSAEYEALPDKTGVYFVYDADSVDAGDFVQKIDQYIELMDNISKILGDTDISKIGDGTVTGAIEKMQNNINIDDQTLVFRNITSGEPTDFTITSGGGGGLSQDEIDDLLGTTDISDIGDGTVTGAIAYLDEDCVHADDSPNIVPAIDPTNNYVYTSGPGTPTISTLGGVDADTLGGQTPDFYVNKDEYGSADISKIGDGTITGAISTLASGGGSGSGSGISSSILGNTDISSIGDGTLTGAIDDINDKKADNKDLLALTQAVNDNKTGIQGLKNKLGSTSISGIGDGTITGALSSLASGSSNSTVMTRINELIGTTDISNIADGTITGAIADFDQNKINVFDFNKLMGTADISMMEDGTITGILACMHKTIDQLFHSVSNGKKLVANAITDKGIPTREIDTFATMANNISSIVTGIRNVQPVNNIPYVSLHGHYPNYNSYLKIFTDKCVVLKADKIDVALDPLMIIDLDKVRYESTEIHMFGSDDSSFQTSHYMHDGAIWKMVKDIPYPFCNGCAVVYRGEIHVLGSSLKDEDGNSCSRKHYKWNGLRWIEVSTLPYDFYNGCAIVYDGDLHILGGEDKSCHTCHYRFSNDYGWVKESVLPFNLYDGNAVVFNNELHILGGGGDSNAHYSYNGIAWTQASILPYSCYKACAVAYDNTIRLLGGADEHATGHYTWNGVTWSANPALPYEFTNGIATVIDDEIHIFGTEDIDRRTYHYSYNGATWTKCVDNPYNFNLGAVVQYNIPDISIAVLDIVEDGRIVRDYVLDITGVKNIGIYCRGDSDKSVVSITNLGWG